MNDELPEGWATASTQTLFAFVTSGSRGWAQYYADHGPLFLRIANLDHDRIAIDLRERQFVQPPPGIEGTRTRVRCGDILISITADVGMVGLVHEDIGEAYINQHIALARPVDGFNRNYLAWYIAATDGGLAQLRELQRGATKVGLGLDDIRALDVPMAPLEEQDRIVEQIETLVAKVQSIQQRFCRIPAVLKRFRQAVLAAACDGRLTQDLRGSQRSGVRKEVALGEIAAEIRTGPFGSALHKSDYAPGGVPVINPMNLVQGKIIPSAQVAVHEATFNRLQEYALKANDIIIARRGEMGRCALVTAREAGWLCGTGSAILRLKPEARPAYVALVISSPAARGYLSEASVGTTMDNLNQQVFKAMPVFLPLVHEQDEIVRRVRDLNEIADRLETRYEKAKQQVDKLTQSVLAKAFRGELVPTEAELARREGRSYETAEELLARIQVTHVNGTSAPRGPRKKRARA